MAPPTCRVIGAFFEVYNVLGHGFLESVYCRALALELRARGLSVAREVPIDARYKGAPVGSFRGDLLVDGSLLVEVKATARPHPADRAQLHNYLRASAHREGVLLHFGEEPSFWCLTVPARDGAWRE